MALIKPFRHILFVVKPEVVYGNKSEADFEVKGFYFLTVPGNESAFEIANHEI
jgi:hypothetical protein